MNILQLFNNHLLLNSLLGLLLKCILSSKNPWFCQSKFLGIATGIPW